MREVALGARLRGDERRSVVDVRNHIEIRLEQCLHGRCDRCRKKPLDAGVPFAAAARFLASEIVETRARMRVDHPKGGGLGEKMSENARERRVLDDVGEVAGVEGVTVVHWFSGAAS